MPTPTEYLERAVRELNGNIVRLDNTLQLLMTDDKSPNLVLLLNELGRLTKWLERQEEPRIGG